MKRKSTAKDKKPPKPVLDTDSSQLELFALSDSDKDSREDSRYTTSGVWQPNQILLAEDEELRTAFALFPLGCDVFRTDLLPDDPLSRGIVARHGGGGYINYRIPQPKGWDDKPLWFIHFAHYTKLGRLT